jgi:cell division protein FtsW (lipid II flippase)
MKIIVLLLSIIGTVSVYLTRNSVPLEFCLATDKDCRNVYDSLENILYFVPLVLVFSLITYWLPVRVFNSWLKFLLVWGSLTLLVTTLIHTGYLLPDRDVYSNGLKTLITFLMYGIFVIGSIITIVRGINRKNRLAFRYD